MEQLLDLWQSLLVAMQHIGDSLLELYTQSWVTGFFSILSTQMNYQANQLSFSQILFCLLPLIFIAVALNFLTKHPLYFLNRKNNILRLSWRKISHFYNFPKIAKVLAENEHYGFKPSIEVVIYKSTTNLFSSVEVFSLGSKRFALIVPEKKWILKNDEFYAKLLKPIVVLKRRLLIFNTLIFFFTNCLKSAQQRIFNFLNRKIKNADLKNFMLISLYIFFLPLMYTRLNFRYYAYFNLMKKLYGEEVALKLSQDKHLELQEFLNKPITYFFGQVHEKL